VWPPLVVPAMMKTQPHCQNSTPEHACEGEIAYCLRKNGSVTDWHRDCLI
jgi:hypothetical protein